MFPASFAPVKVAKHSEMRKRTIISIELLVILVKVIILVMGTDEGGPVVSLSSWATIIHSCGNGFTAVFLRDTVPTSSLMGSVSIPFGTSACVMGRTDLIQSGHYTDKSCPS